MGKGFDFSDDMKIIGEGECRYKIIEIDDSEWQYKIERGNTVFYNNEPWIVWTRHENRIEIRRG